MNKKLNKKDKITYDWLISHPGYFKKSSDVAYDFSKCNDWYKFKEIYNQAKVDYKKSLDSQLTYAKPNKTLKKAAKKHKSDVVLKSFADIFPWSTDNASTKAILRLSKNQLKSIDKPKKFKRLFFDIETSYNVVSSWRVGYKINIGPENIIKERAIICICWKWQGESKIHSLEWNKGDDKEMLIKFIDVMNQADEVVGQNSDRFDIKWIRTRCIFHGIPMLPDYQSLDTLKLAKAGFNFNSNKLDYMGKFLGVGQKVDTGGFKLWQDIIIDNCSKAMKKMIDYCKGDITLLESVYDKLNPYTKAKTHVGVTLGLGKDSCPACGSLEHHNRGRVITALGTIKQRVTCNDCRKYFYIKAK